MLSLHHFNVFWYNSTSIVMFVSEVESRTQGSRPRPRTQKKSEAKAKDSLSEDRHSRGQGQECSRPRTKDTSASALQKKKRFSQKFFRRSPKKKKRSSQIFERSPQKNVFQKIFQPLHKILTIKKIVLSSSRGQANLRGLEASRPRPRTSKCVLEDSTSGSYVFTVAYLWLLFFSHYFFVTAKAALPKKSLVFAARQIANNLSRIAKKL